MDTDLNPFTRALQQDARPDERWENSTDSPCRRSVHGDSEPVTFRFQFVSLAFDRPQTVVDLPKWRWPVIGPYNGFDGAARIRAWQLVRFYELNGWLRYPQVCSVTGWEGQVALHQEDYARPWNAYPVSRRAHLLIHTRERYPHKWAAFLAKEALPDAWAKELTPNCDATAKRCTAAELFALAPHPLWVAVPMKQLYGERRSQTR